MHAIKESWISGYTSHHDVRLTSAKQIVTLLTLNVRGPNYLGLTRSISWLLVSPGHQQPWYCLCKICRSLSYPRKDFKPWDSSTWVLSMWRNDIKCKYLFMFPLQNLARKGLSPVTLCIISWKIRTVTIEQILIWCKLMLIFLRSIVILQLQGKFLFWLRIYLRRVMTLNIALTLTYHEHIYQIIIFRCICLNLALLIQKELL